MIHAGRQEPESQSQETRHSKPCRFDLRLLALAKLKDLSNGSGFVYYREARRHLGMLLHLPKLEARRLLLEMSKAGLISFDLRGKLWLGNRERGERQKTKDSAADLP